MSVIWMAFIPETVSVDLPCFCGIQAFVGKCLDILRVGEVSGVGARQLNHAGQAAWVIEQWTGAQMILVEGLVSMVLHEQRPPVSLQQGLLMDIGIGVMDKGAGLNVAAGIDVQVIASSCDTSLDVLAVVPEIQGKQGLGSPEAANLVIHVLPLVRGGHELGHSIHAHGHVGKKPAKLTALFDHCVKIRLTADDISILAVITGGKAKGQLFSL